MSAPNVSCQRHCEYDYTLIPHSPTYRIKKHELELTGRRGYPVGRCLLELMICLFVIEWPQGCLSSANSGSHQDFFFFAGLSITGIRIKRPNAEGALAYRG